MATQNLIQLLASGLRDLDGGVLAGGKVYHYESGTTTKKAIYEDDAAAVESAQPIVLDSRGCAKVYGTGLYDLVVTDAAGATIESFNGLNAGDAPGSLTAAGLLTLLKTVDGATSGLDSDLLDSRHGSEYLLASAYNAADILSKLLNVDGAGSGLDADKLDGLSSDAFATAAQGALADTALQASLYTAADVLAKLLTVDGTGSGLDADKLDGVEGSGYALAAHNHTLETLLDVLLSSPVAGEILKYNGSKWVNSSFSSKGLVGVVAGSGTIEITSPSYIVGFVNGSPAAVFVVYYLTKLGTLDSSLKVDGVTPSAEELVQLATFSFQYGAGVSMGGGFYLIFS